MHRWTQKDKFTKPELEELIVNLHLGMVSLLHQTEAIYRAYVKKTTKKYD